MKILHLTEGPLSNAPFNLCRVQRIGGMDARLISHKNRYTDVSNIVYPHDILLQDGRSNGEKRKEPTFDKEIIFDLFNACDVLHFHNYVDDHFVFRLFPELKKYLNTKQVVLQIHSPRNSLGKVSAQFKKKYVDKKLVVAQYQVRQYPECMPVPNVLDINHPLLVPAPNENTYPKISFSPSNTKLKGWNNKGLTETVNAIKRVGYPYMYDLITDTPYYECLKRRQSSDICIDEIVTGSYHMCSLEGMSQGLAVINNMDKDCLSALESYIGVGVDHPMLTASSDNLPKLIESLLKDEDYLNEVKRSSRLFMENHWNPTKLNRKFKEIYEA